MKKILFILSFLMPFIVDGQTISTIAGCGICSSLGDGGPATAANWGGGPGITTDIYNALITADPNNNSRIRRINQTTGIITTIAGNGTLGYGGDLGPATLAMLNKPVWVACDTSGNLFISDGDNERVRKVNPAGVISTYAGNGLVGFSGDGFPATSASFNGTQGVATDVFGNLYIVDGGNVRIRKVDVTGIISTICGYGSTGFSGDGGPATAAEFSGALGICTDSAGNVYFADYGNHRVRKIDVSTGIITTVAGTGGIGYSGDGMPATSSTIFNPMNVAIDPNGNLHIADYSNHRIRKVNSSCIISTVAGIGTTGYSGDGGAATAAQLYGPRGVTFDVCGNMYIADFTNKRIRKVSYPPILTTPAISITGSTSMPVGSMVTVNATVASAGSSYIIHWMNHGIEFTTTTVPIVTYIKMPGIDTITARVVPLSYGCYDSTTSTEHYVSTNTTGINQRVLDYPFTIYPNPAQNSLKILGPNIFKVTICNLVGEVLHSGAYSSGEVAVDISKQAPGLYFIRINDTYVEKYTKQ